MKAYKVGFVQFAKRIVPAFTEDDEEYEANNREEACVQAIKKWLCVMDSGTAAEHERKRAQENISSLIEGYYNLRAITITEAKTYATTLRAFMNQIY